MPIFKKIIYFLFRVSLGWLMFYAGITKILNPKWTAKEYLLSAKTFPEFYHRLSADNIITVVNFLNEWGLALIGISLILGLFIRISTIFGAVLMLLYYFPILQFPYVGKNSYIVDEHIIYIFVFLTLFVIEAGKYWGLDAYRIVKKQK